MIANIREQELNEMKPTILIIEDEGRIVDNIVYALKTEGYNTLWCSTVMEGLEAVKKKRSRCDITGCGITGYQRFWTV